MDIYKTQDDNINIYNGDSLECYSNWPTPVVIIADGPYGIGGFPGDPPTPDALRSWYEPHIKLWTAYSTPQTTLWFWNTEHGWANVHSLLQEYGWEYVNCHIWDKGIGHIAGNANTKTLRKLPVVTEVCAQYVRKAEFRVNDRLLNMQEWLRHEWLRSGLPLNKTNEACGVKNAATRKYFTKCHLWYYPPPEAFEKLSDYANTFGQIDGRPYFSIDGKNPISKLTWTKMRSKFSCPYGTTNVWREPALNGTERIKVGSKAYHLNQKPLKLMRLIIEISSDVRDVIWEPFGGLCSGAVAAHKLKRKCYTAEKDYLVFAKALERFDIEEK